ncbi:MAG: DNA-processing protein DprA [Muribaculum sp.]|nr:DNA-processing protein DprA [Muribaculum sp.]
MADIYQIAFASLRGITRRLADEILARTGDEKRFFSSTGSRLAAVMGCSNRLFDDSYRAGLLEKARKEMSFIDSNGVTALYFTDSDYPARLSECDDAPLLLYGLGDCDLNSAHIISIVGTRHATAYGTDFVIRLVEDLAKKLDNVVIVSGLAYGIDIVAHRAALHCGIPTVAVLAHGLNTIYPAAHRSTAAEIVRSGGMLLTDYMTQDSLHKGNFVARNRIVAGLADCTIVAESAIKGGALITAGIASAYHRDVAALPGRTSDRYSLGCNKLIADNTAALISDADSLIDMMGWKAKPHEGEQTTLSLSLSPEEEAIVSYLTDHGDGDINTLGVALDIPMHRLMPLLVDMEFKNLILTFPGGKYRLA